MTIAPTRKPHAAMSASKALPSYAHGAREFLAKRFAIRVGRTTWIQSIMAWEPATAVLTAEQYRMLIKATRNDDGPVTLK
jgi:hypothetical protein